jgi:hypothetical protein
MPKTNDYVLGTHDGEIWSDTVHGEIATLSANPNAVMITPMVMQIIAEKLPIPAPGTRSSPAVATSITANHGNAATDD